MTVQIRPIRRYPEPKYPTGRVLEENPALLRALPMRWRKKTLVLASLAGVALLQTQCRGTGVANAQVAPLFIHGEGRGATGCVAVNPPAFLSEEDARSVIMEEAKKAGINFTADCKTLSQVRVPVTNEFGFGGNDILKTKTASFCFDGTDRNRNISFEYVSLEDFRQWEGDERNYSSASDFDIQGAAKVLRNGLEGSPEAGVSVVFYDPMINKRSVKEPDSASNRSGTYIEELNASIREAAGAPLRLQVRDFIAWLTAQGIV